MNLINVLAVSVYLSAASVFPTASAFINWYVEGTHNDGSDDAFAHPDQMVSELNQGECELSETCWRYKDSMETSDRRAVFYLDFGGVASCKSVGCRSCTVCDELGELEEGLRYAIECSDGYLGSFPHTYDFGVITE